MAAWTISSRYADVSSGGEAAERLQPPGLLERVLRAFALLAFVRPLALRPLERDALLHLAFGQLAMHLDLVRELPVDLGRDGDIGVALDVEVALVSC